MELRSTPLLWIEDLQVYPHLSTKSVTVRGRIGNRTGRAGGGVVKLSAEPAPAGFVPLPPVRTVPVSWDSGGGVFAAEYDLGEGARPLDEFASVLYRLSARLGADGDWRSVTFGLREISADGTVFRLNGRPAFIRGTLE